MTSSNFPSLQQMGASKQLIVDGKPFLILGGELQNSSFSSPEYMEGVWSKLVDINLNTILANISWEQIEPVEGHFDFRAFDHVLADARKHGLRIVLLWFGSFKNGLSTYAPSWVKQDPSRFPRANLRDRTGNLITADVLSVFGTEAQEADAQAFRMLMQHLKEVDHAHSTVIMVQVENEVGILGDSRDHCDLAQKAFGAQLPSDFIQFLHHDWSDFTTKFQENLATIKEQLPLGKDTSWADLKADEARVNELFMAYHYAHFINRVASAGKMVYPLPLYTNVWQNYGDTDADPNSPNVAAGGHLPGDYPSGGGVVDVLDVWQAFAPSLDIIGPDIYLNDYSSSCQKYSHGGQPLFIPEQRRDEYGAIRMWLAFGSHHCIGVAPFGIDTVDPAESPFTKHYALLAKTAKYILPAQSRRDGCIGFYFDKPDLAKDGSSTCLNVIFGSWELKIERSFVFGKPANGSGMVIHLDDDQFLLIGWGFQVSFRSNMPKAHFTGLLEVLEQDIDEDTGDLRTVRWLNGDETRSGQSVVMPSESPDYGGFPISITVPARTAICLVKPYALVDR